MTEISKLLGPYVQLIDCRPHLVRSVLLPHSALPWLIQTLAATVHLQSIVKPKWCNRSEHLSFRASVLSNAKGRFIRIVEELPVGRIASICIPEVLAALAGRPSIRTSPYMPEKWTPHPFLAEHTSFINRTLYLSVHIQQPKALSPSQVPFHPISSLRTIASLNHGITLEIPSSYSPTTVSIQPRTPSNAPQWQTLLSVTGQTIESSIWVSWPVTYPERHHCLLPPLSGLLELAELCSSARPPSNPTWQLVWGLYYLNAFLSHWTNGLQRLTLPTRSLLIFKVGSLSKGCHSIVRIFTHSKLSVHSVVDW